MRAVHKALFSLCVLLFSCVSVQLLCLPLYEYVYGCVYAYRGSLVSLVLRCTGYDLLSEHTLNMWVVCAFCGYMCMGVVCLLLDVCLPVQWKAQGRRSYFTVREWLEALGVSLFNLFVTSWTVSIPYTWMWKYDDHMIKQSDPLNIYVEALKFAGCVVVIEVWFYVTHYALHTPVLYARIHKMHHRFKAPVAVASMYAHPVEYAVGNLMGVILGPILTNCHPMTSYVWIFNSLMTTGGSHSGHKLFDAEFHDAHHQYFDYNYGISGVTDFVFNTLWEGSNKWKQLQMKKHKLL